MIVDFISKLYDVTFTYQLTACVLSFGLIVSAFEDITTWSIYCSNGLLSWKVSRLGYKLSKVSFVSRLLDLLLCDRIFKISLYARILLSFALLVLSFFNIIPPLIICTLFFLMLLVALRNFYGLDGGYQMYLVLLFGLSIATLAGLESLISKICLYFIAGELILSYFIAGINKLISPIWRKPHALILIFSTRTYGHPFFFKYFRKNQLLALALSWIIIGFETVFFLVLFLPPPYSFALCLIGLLFHLFNGLFMGLNDFVLSFTATYPALFFCIASIQTVL